MFAKFLTLDGVMLQVPMKKNCNVNVNLQSSKTTCRDSL